MLTLKEEYDRRKAVEKTRQEKLIAEKHARQEKLIAESWKVKLKDPAFLFAGVTTIFTGFLALTAYLQWQALTSTDIASHDLANVAKNQLVAMQGQLDAMESDKRPWIRAELSLNGPIQFVEWNGTKGSMSDLKSV